MGSRAEARSDETVAGKFQEAAPGPQRTITRSRTGCFTCRKRKKKCDERRPECGNCNKANVQCEFETKQKWEVKNAAKRAQRETIQRPINVELRPLFSSSPAPPGIHSNVLPFQSPVFSQTDAPAISNQDFGIGQSTSFYSMGMSNFGTQSNYDLHSTSTGSPQDVLSVFDNYEETENGGPSMTARTADGLAEYTGVAHTILQEDFELMHAELPYPINGLEDSEIHQRLFWHFTKEMSHLLTTFGGNSNPMNAEVIPLAMRDTTVMKTVLCLAACHILKKQHPTDDIIFQEKERLYSDACAEQFRRARLQYKSRDSQEVIFATSLLLCLYEICEGTGKSTWKTHLDMAREALMMGPRSPDLEFSDDGEPETIVTEVNPFLLEYFIYHDSLATVTLPSSPPPKLRFQGSARYPHHDPSMIGVNDGLCDFVTKISAIRAEVDASPRKLDGIVVQKALPIFLDITKWQINGISRQCRLIAKFYQWALWIWLYSIVYPHEKGNEKVQKMVKGMTVGMNDIESGHGVMSCLLFPLFVIGSAAIKKEDRDAISFQFQRLKDWSSLGNIDLAFCVVQKMWVDHDTRMPDSWDWVKQLESRNLSILVT